jgi:hypothetical protein
MDNININSTHLEQVKSFKYLGSIVNGNDSIEEEIKERISLSNKAYYANQKLFKNKLLSKKSKLKVYWTLVRSVLTYACETWVLKESIKQKLLVFERKIRRRIFGPTKEKNRTWRIKTNEDLNKLTRNKNVINYIKAQRLGWLGHVHRMPDDRMVKKIYEWKPMSTRTLGRPKTRWENDVRNYIKTMRVHNWSDCIQDRCK